MFLFYKSAFKASVTFVLFHATAFATPELNSRYIEGPFLAFRDNAPAVKLRLR